MLMVGGLGILGGAMERERLRPQIKNELWAGDGERETPAANEEKALLAVVEARDRETQAARGGE
jgi:hypothetical protein